MKIKYLYAALVAAGCLGLSSVQASSINVVGPTSFQFGVDTSFSLDIVGVDLLEGLNSTGDLSFYTQGGGIHIDFDPAVLNVSSASIAAFWDFFPDSSFDNTAGTIELFASRIGSTPISNPQQIASLTFDIVAAGNTTLDLSSSTIFGGFAYTADVVPPPSTGAQTTISAFYCVDGIQTTDPGTGLATCGHGALDGNPSIMLNDVVINVAGIPAIPVPAAVWLFGSGLIGLVGVARRKTVSA